jgi:hypothetical protein
MVIGMNSTKTVTITANDNPSFAKLVGTWEVYNVTAGMVHLCRLINGKRAAIAAKNLLNLTEAQFAEISQ